jgi:hypothetical protein
MDRIENASYKDTYLPYIAGCAAGEHDAAGGLAALLDALARAVSAWAAQGKDKNSVTYHGCAESARCV